MRICPKHLDVHRTKGPPKILTTNLATHVEPPGQKQSLDDFQLTIKASITEEAEEYISHIYYIYIPYISQKVKEKNDIFCLYMELSGVFVPSCFPPLESSHRPKILLNYRRQRYTTIAIPRSNSTFVVKVPARQVSLTTFRRSKNHGLQKSYGLWRSRGR